MDTKQVKGETGGEIRLAAGICGNCFFRLDRLLSGNGEYYYSLWIVDVIPSDFTEEGMEKFIEDNRCIGYGVGGSWHEIIQELAQMIDQYNLGTSPDRVLEYLGDAPDQKGWFVKCASCGQLYVTHNGTFSCEVCGRKKFIHTDDTKRPISAAGIKRMGYRLDNRAIGVKCDEELPSRKMIAYQIVEVFESLLDGKGIKIRCSDEDEERQRDMDENTAKLYGTEYEELVEKVEDILEKVKKEPMK